MTKKEKITILTGTYDPVTVSDLHKIRKAKANCDILVIGIHSDYWLVKNVGGYFMDYDDRKEIVESLKEVNEVFTYDDRIDNVQLIKLVKICYPNSEIFYICETPEEDAEMKLKGIKRAYIK